MRRIARLCSGCGGFTLLELVVAAGLAVLILAVALELSWRGLGLAAGARAGFEETAELRSAAAWVSRDLRRAEAVVEAASGRLVLAAGGAEVAYRFEGGDLVRDEGGARRVVARGIAAADFAAEERDGGVLVSAEFRGAKGGRARTCVWVYTGS